VRVVGDHLLTALDARDRAAAVVEAARALVANGDFPDLLDTNNEAAWALCSAIRALDDPTRGVRG